MGIIIFVKVISKLLNFQRRPDFVKNLTIASKVDSIRAGRKKIA